MVRTPTTDNNPHGEYYPVLYHHFIRHPVHNTGLRAGEGSETISMYSRFHLLSKFVSILYI